MSRHFGAVLRYGAVAIACVALAACSQATFMLVNFPSRFADIRVERDIAFGDGAQKLDIYRPAGDASEPRDVVVFFYGGRWTTGSKDDYEFVGTAFAERGFVVVIPDYSKYPAVRFPVFVQDGAKALAWVYDNVGKYGGSAARIHVAGHSSGAHIGALLTVDAAYLAALGKRRADVIHDFTGLAGPYSFTPDEPDLEDMFGPPAAYLRMQATTYVDGRQPPMFLLWGAADKDVGRINLDRMIQAVHAKGGCLETKIYPGTDHVGIVGGLSWVNPDHIPVLDDMTAFFRTGAGKDDCHASAGEPAR